MIPVFKLIQPRSTKFYTTAFSLRESEPEGKTPFRTISHLVALRRGVGLQASLSRTKGGAAQYELVALDHTRHSGHRHRGERDPRLFAVLLGRQRYARR